MIDYMLRIKNITGENSRRAIAFYDAIRFLNKHSRLGATRNELYYYFKRRYQLDEISRFLQYLKSHDIITLKDQSQNVWVEIC